MDSLLRARVSAALGTSVVSAERAEGGYAHNERWIVTCGDGSSAFVKAAVDEDTAEWLRIEYLLYSTLRGDFMPGLLGWDQTDRPLLILEDLSAASWPPPWNRARVEAVLTALADVAATPAPAGLPALEDRREDLAGWALVAQDPAPFLGLGLCTPAWLERSLPSLVAAETTCTLAGEGMLHFDVRSDNVCIRETAAVLVDWNWACRGNPVIDVAAWLPSLHAEGGPAPEEILPDEPEAAALISGYLAARAGLPTIARAPRVREAQLIQLRAALPWAVAELELESLPPATVG